MSDVVRSTGVPEYHASCEEDGCRFKRGGWDAPAASRRHVVDTGHQVSVTRKQQITFAPPLVAHQSDENASTGVSEGDTRRNGAEKP